MRSYEVTGGHLFLYKNMPLQTNSQYSYSPPPHSHVFLPQSPVVPSLPTLSHGDQDHYSNIHTEGWSSSSSLPLCPMCFLTVFVFLHSVFVFFPIGPVRPFPGSICPSDEPVFSSTGSVCPPTGSVCLPTEAMCLANGAVCSPIEAMCPPTGAMCPPTYAMCPPNEAVCPPTEAMCLPTEFMCLPTGAVSPPTWTALTSRHFSHISHLRDQQD